MNAVAPSPTTASPAVAAQKPPVFGPGLLLGIAGILGACLTASLNGIVVDVALVDILGAVGIGHDEGTWLTALYRAPEVAAAAFAPWFAVTFSLRRFTLFAIAGLMTTGLLLPLATDFSSLLLLRTLQGLLAGCLPPMLMTAAMRFLPPAYRLYGLGAYALTATVGPNLGIPLAAFWTEYLGWQFAFWQVVPPGLICLAAVAQGIPQDPPRLERFRQFNWTGLLCGFPGLCALVIALLQGERLNWLQSPLIGLLLAGGSGLLLIFLINESRHPSPFFDLQVLRRHNIAHGLLTLFAVLIVVSATLLITVRFLALVQDYRLLQTTPLPLILAFAQLLVLPAVSAFCNRPAVDCRWVMAMGLALCSLSLIAASKVTGDWSRTEFYWLLVPLGVGQPMVVVALLLSCTSVVAPAEGPAVSAWFNTTRALAAVAGGVIVGLLFRQRGEFHANRLIDGLGNNAMTTELVRQPLDGLRQQIAEQAQVLATADLYLMMAALAALTLLFIPLVPQRVYPPNAGDPAPRPINRIPETTP